MVVSLVEGEIHFAPAHLATLTTRHFARPPDSYVSSGSYHSCGVTVRDGLLLSFLLVSPLSFSSLLFSFTSLLFPSLLSYFLLFPSLSYAFNNSLSFALRLHDLTLTGERGGNLLGTRRRWSLQCAFRQGMGLGKRRKQALVRSDHDRRCFLLGIRRRQPQGLGDARRKELGAAERWRRALLRGDKQWRG